ncbi:MAG: NAD(P)-dependent oxidoreductase [Candidatus ainarchaeum sp.]|nr:NAD(P)-dependent oxidoreductase [Candidatus ainarchaeum sp.]
MKNGKTILITGASGYIGSALASELAGEKKVAKLVCIGGPAGTDSGSFERLEKHCLKRKKNCVFERAAILDREKISSLLKGVDVAVHLASVHNVDECAKNPERTWATNVEGTRLLLGECVKQNVKRIVFPSSILVYGNSDGKKITEETALSPQNEYARQKAACEKYCAESGLNCIILRKSNVFGAGFITQTDTVIPIFILKALKEKKIEIHGTGRQEKNFLYITDAVQAYKKAIFSDYAGILNIGGRETRSILSIAEIISKKLGAGITHIPSPREEPKKLGRVFICEKAEKEIGFVPKKSIEKGIDEFIRWAKKEAA